jgi:hypothetical protein
MPTSGEIGKRSAALLLTPDPARPSAVVQEVVEDAHAEPERIDRNPLVHAMEHAEEVQVSRQAQGREPEAPDPQSAERLRICATGQAIRNDLG